MLQLLFAFYFFFLAAIRWVLGLLIAPLSLFTPAEPLIQRRLTSFFLCRLVMISPGWKLTVEGEENLAASGPFVLVANHQSLADIVILHALKHYFKWVSKESIFYVPFLGWIMVLERHVPIKRGDIKSTRIMIQECEKWLKRGVSVMMFPEGTRSPDGKLREFRDGSFRLARHCGVPVVPIAINGTHEVLAKGSTRLCFNAHMHIRIMPPVTVAAFNNDAAAMRDAVHAQIQRALDDMRLKPQALPTNSALAAVEQQPG